VQQQPTVVLAPVRRYGTGDHGLIYAIVASVCIFFFGVWCTLICTIPAIFISINVSMQWNYRQCLSMAVVTVKGGNFTYVLVKDYFCHEKLGAEGIFVMISMYPDCHTVDVQIYIQWLKKNANPSSPMGVEELKWLRLPILV
jgi:hypothetical protein